MSKNILLYIGQDGQIEHKLARNLKSAGIELHKIRSISSAEDIFQKQLYDLFLIHFESVCEQIFESCSFIRSQNPGAITIVLMTKPQTKIEKQLFDCGVDDVVTGNPICTLALTSRIKRRIYNGKLQWVQANKIMLKGGALVDLSRTEVHLDGSIRTLTGSTDKLLRYFLSNPDRVISKDELWESDIWEKMVCRSGKEEEGKAFDMAIGRLKRVIEADPKNPQIIKTVHGQGWMLARDAVL